VDTERLTDNISRRHTGIQGGIGILKDDLHVALDPTQFLFCKRCQIHPLESDFSGSRFQKTQDQPSNRRLSTARLPNEPQDLAPVKVKADAVDGLNLPPDAGKKTAPDGEIFFQVFDVEHGSFSP
jgi:hypothetical protein